MPDPASPAEAIALYAATATMDIAGIKKYGDIANFEQPLRDLVEAAVPASA